MSRKVAFSVGLMLTGLLLVPVSPLRAADHRDAPAVDGAGEGDITDVFAFLDPNDASRLILAMGVNPFAVPAATHSYRFSKDYLYQFKIDRTGSFREDFVIQFRFEDTPTGQRAHVRVGVPDPAYVGANNLYLVDAPSQLDLPTGQIGGQGNDIQVFTGLRDDPFVLDGQFFRITANLQDVFRDIPTSPLGHLRGRPVRADGTSGVDMFGGFNASYIVVGIPLSWLGPTRDVINIWGTISAPVDETGSYIQFERMGQPLFNTVFMPNGLKDAFNQGVPADDMSRWAKYVPDSLTTTDNDGTGNTISGRAGLLTALGLATPPNGAPLLLPASFANTNKDLLRVALLPDVLRLSVKLAPTDLGIGQFGLTNGRRPGDDVVDIALRVLRQLADVNLPAALKVPGSGPARSGALNADDRRFFAVLQGTDFIRPDANLGDLTTSGNDKPFLGTFPFFAEPHPRPGDPGTIGFPALGTSPVDFPSSLSYKQ
ncbi:MAG: DUF4331 domain-containing protein [Acidobacteriota bacterium]|nr:DUF4331 domain-containing protein [Acidobacteriota bacterium]